MKLSAALALLLASSGCTSGHSGSQGTGAGGATLSAGAGGTMLSAGTGGATPSAGAPSAGGASGSGGASSSSGGSSATDGGSAVDSGSQPRPEDGPWAFVVLKQEMFTTNGRTVRVEKIRADRPDGAHSYLLYQHALTEPAPLLIQEEPYAGIDWTGDALDTRWAAQGDGLKPDVDGPDYNGTDVTTYTAQSPQAAVDANNAWTVNGFATIHAYARFYAGGTLEDDALDAAAPYFFARSRSSELDLTRIGAYGGSWGGMMALFGASHAPKDAAPRAVVAMSTPSDFVDLWTYSKTTLPELYPNKSAVEAFYSPYWRRATPTLGAPPAGAAALPFTPAGICPGLRGRFLAPQDDWDVIIPVGQTHALAKACANVEPIYWPRGKLDYTSAAIDHGPFTSEGTLPSVLTFSVAFLVEELAPATSTTLYAVASSPSLAIHLRLILAEQRAGHDVSYILARLREVADPRLQVIRAEDQQLVSGARVLADAVNDVWKTSFDETSLRTQLQTGLPAPTN